MNARPTSYAEVFKPQPSELEAAQIWRQVEARVHADRGRARRVRLVTVAAGVVLAAAAAFLFFLTRHSRVSAGQTVEARDDGGEVLELSDGSRVELEPGARAQIVRMDSAVVEVRLVTGAAAFEVTHVPHRSFAVLAADVDVHVVGTRFRVAFGKGSRTPEEVSVEVTRGIVEVRRPGGRAPLLLEHGERWSTAATAALPALPPAANAAAASVDSAVPAPPGPTAAVGGEPPAPGAPSNLTAADSADALFDAANKARVAGRSEEAGRLFDRMRKSYRGDARAALAAFQLGRLRLDSLGAPGGAAEAFADALALGGNPSLQDDARARLVEAYDRAGNVAACRKAQQVYLAREVGGAHRAVVERRCGGGDSVPR